MAEELARLRQMVRHEHWSQVPDSCTDFLTTGYYIVNVMCVLVGAVTFWLFIRPQALKLQQLPMRAWRISDS
jgi:hypothetical protein